MAVNTGYIDSESKDLASSILQAVKRFKVMEMTCVNYIPKVRLGSKIQFKEKCF